MTQTRGGLRAALLLLVGLVLAGCESLPPALPASAPLDTRLDVPFYPQKAHQCGPAALAEMLGWAGKTATPDQLTDEVWLPQRKGSLAIEMAAAARARGLLVYPLASDPNAILREVAAGHPVLVLQNLGLVHWPVWHYAVVIGYDNQGQTVVLHSGDTARKTMAWNRFIRTWARGNYWAVVILPPDRLPATASPRPLVRAGSNLEQTGQFTAAGTLWQQALKRFPDNYLVCMAAGNHAWQAGQHDQALDHFMTATRVDPGQADGWNNLAEALSARGCQTAARNAIRRALQLAPGKDTYLQTQKDIEKKPARANARCPALPDSR